MMTSGKDDGLFRGSLNDIMSTSSLLPPSTSTRDREVLRFYSPPINPRICSIATAVVEMMEVLSMRHCFRMVCCTFKLNLRPMKETTRFVRLGIRCVDADGHTTGTGSGSRPGDEMYPKDL